MNMRDPRRQMDDVAEKYEKGGLSFSRDEIEVIFRRLEQLETAIDNVSGCLGNANSYIRGNR